MSSKTGKDMSLAYRTTLTHCLARGSTKATTRANGLGTTLSSILARFRPSLVQPPRFQTSCLTYIYNHFHFITNICLSMDSLPIRKMPKAFNPATEIPGLTNKVVLVTGGNAGIGAAIVRALAPHNPECIYLCTRRRSSGDEVVKAIHQEQPDAKVEVLELDLNSFESVRKCAAEFERRSERLDLLFLNAGISTTKAAMTEEGFESQFGGMSRSLVVCGWMKLTFNSQSYGTCSIDSTPHATDAQDITEWR